MAVETDGVYLDLGLWSWDHFKSLSDRFRMIGLNDLAQQIEQKEQYVKSVEAQVKAVNTVYHSFFERLTPEQFDALYLLDEAATAAGEVSQ